MRPSRLITVVLFWTIAVLGFATTTSARSYVDPTSLTPPLKAFRVCWELGPNVQCDTSGVTSYENLATDEAPCGLIYETATEDGNSTRGTGTACSSDGPSRRASVGHGPYQRRATGMLSRLRGIKLG